MVNISNHLIIVVRCTNEVFIENVFVPILRSGSLEPLFDEMKMSEDYLTKYNMYLLAVCIYLKRQNYVCTLHMSVCYDLFPW